MNEPPTLLRIVDVARELQISRSSVYRLIVSGELPAVRIGKNVRVRRETLARWIEDHEEDPVAAVAVPYLPPQRHR